MLNAFVKSVLVVLFASLTSLAFAKNDVNNFNNNAKKLLNTANNHRQSATIAEQNSYFYLLALPYQTSNNLDEITKVGKKLFDNTQINVANNPLMEQQSKQLANMQERLAKQHDEITSPTDKLFCRFKETTCVNEIVNQSHRWQNLLTEHTPIYQRYQQFLAQPPAVTLTSPNPSMPIPQYALLMKGQRLSLLYKLTLAQHGESDKAIKNSLADLVKLREQLAHADTLIGKMVMNQLVNNELQAIVWLKNHYKTNSDAISPIAPLNHQEKGLELALINEFELQVNTLQQLQPTLPKYQQKFYHHADTVNALADFMQQQIAISQLPNAEFARHLQQPVPTDSPIKLNRITNFIGYQLVNIVMPAFEPYSQRLRATDNAITLTNYVLTDGKTPLTNIFSPVTNGVKVTDKQLCMDLPKPIQDISHTCLTQAN